MLILGLLIGVLATILSLAIGRGNAAGVLARTGLNPYFVICFYIALVQLDFLSFYLDGFGIIARSIVNAPSLTLGEILVAHNVLMIAMLVGCYLGSQAINQQAGRASKQWSSRASAVLLLCISLPYLAPIIGQFLSGQSLLLLGAENHTGEQTAVTFFFSMAILPTWIFFLQGRKLVPATLVFILLAILLVGTGSRTRVLYLIIPFIFYLHFSGFFVFRRAYFLFGLGAGLLLATAAVNYRIAVSQPNIAQIDAAELFSTDNFFRQNDVGFAEIGILMASEKHDLSEYPGESFVGAALAPIPRAIIPFKPNTGSVQFTQAYDSRHYYRHSRALTVGGMLEIYGDYPLIPGALIALFLGAVWGSIFAKASRAVSPKNVSDMSALYIISFAFLRIDIQAAGQIVWAYLVLRAILLLSASDSKQGSLKTALPRRRAAKKVRQF